MHCTRQLILPKNSRDAHKKSLGIYQKNDGFTLIELMIVVVTIGVLATVALPAYSDFTKRSKVSELILIASSCRTEITEILQTGFTTAPIANDWGCNEIAPGGIGISQYVDGIETTTGGVITVTAKNIGAGADGLTITLAPQGVVILANNPVTPDGWLCGGTIEARFKPASCR